MLPNFLGALYTVLPNPQCTLSAPAQMTLVSGVPHFTFCHPQSIDGSLSYITTQNVKGVFTNFYNELI